MPVKFTDFFMLKTIKISNHVAMNVGKSDITPYTNKSKCDSPHLAPSPVRLIIIGG